MMNLKDMKKCKCEWIWVRGHCYDEFTRCDGSTFYAGLTHRDPSTHEPLIKIPKCSNIMKKLR